MRCDVQLEVVREGQRMLRQVAVDVDGFGEHSVLSVQPVDDLSSDERQTAEDLAAIVAGEPGRCS